MAPGTRGVLNAMSPKYFNASAFAGVGPQAGHRVAARAAGSGHLRHVPVRRRACSVKLGAVPGWPGDDVLPPQPMHTQTAAVLRRYAEAGGSVREVALADCAHGIPLEDPQAVADAIEAALG